MAGCKAPPPAEPPPAPPDRIAIVAAQRTPRGVHLVSIDERGDTRRELLAPASVVVRDTNPAISPDGTWVVFASSRGRDSLDDTNLWIAPLEAGATPVPLTHGAWIDAQPVWTQGGAIVFASTRDGGDFDLYRGAFAPSPRPHLATLEALTTAPGHEITPSVGPDGSVAFAAVDAANSHVAVRAADGTTRALTEGPADSSPAISPDGKTLAFSRPVVRAGVIDAELWTMPLAGGEATLLVDLPLTDESGPVWSDDGRYVFATSLLRGADGRPVYSAVIYVDTAESPHQARMLEDRGAPAPRLTPAIAAHVLDRAALAKNPEYLPELAKLLAKPMIDAKQRDQPPAP